MKHRFGSPNTALGFQRNLDLLLDSEVGILQEIKEVARLSSDPYFFHYAGRACNALPLSGHESFFNSGGASLTREIAIYKAIGEAIERYSSSFYDDSDLRLSSFDSADFRCAHPNSFALYSREQYMDDNFLFVPFDEDTVVNWTESINLSTGETTFIPAAAVFMPYTYVLSTNDSPILQPISTGLACHKSHEDALVSALCEVVERDAVMMMWQRMLSFPQIRIETLSEYNYEIVNRLEKNGSRVFMFNITLDHGIPTVLSVLSGELNRKLPRYVFAAAADPDPEEAVRKSLEEIPHTRRYCARILSYSPDFLPRFPAHENVTDQLHHLHFYSDFKNEEFASFVFRNKKRISFEEIASKKKLSKKETLRELVSSIKGTGEDTYFRDLTTPDVRQFGFTVARVVIPGYQRLCMGYSNRCLGGNRFLDIHKKIDCEFHLPNGFKDNPAPHPYP